MTGGNWEDFFFEEPKRNDPNLKGRKMKGPEERPILGSKQKITSSRTQGVEPQLPATLFITEPHRELVVCRTQHPIQKSLNTAYAATETVQLIKHGSEANLEGDLRSNRPRLPDT
jgi:hypothetical protein